jgi:hypothetical protein
MKPNDETGLSGFEQSAISGQWSARSMKEDTIIKPASEYSNKRHAGLDPASSPHLDSGWSLSRTGCGAGMTRLRYLNARVIS